MQLYSNWKCQRHNQAYQCWPLLNRKGMEDLYNRVKSKLSKECAPLYFICIVCCQAWSQSSWAVNSELIEWWKVFWQTDCRDATPALLKYPVCSWTDVTASHSQTGHFYTSCSNHACSKHFCNNMTSVQSQCHALFIFFHNSSVFSFHSRASSPTLRPQGMLDLPICQIRFIASL